MFTGLGTVINIVAILLGSTVGVFAGGKLPERTRNVVTDVLGLVTAVAAVSSAAEFANPDLKAAVGKGWPIIVMLLSLLLGGIVGSLIRIEDRLDGIGERLKQRFGANGDETFVEGFVTASLIFCVGPLAILASVSDGLGTGIDQLILKSCLDFFASLAFASTLGWGVAASAIAVGVYQGLWTFIGSAVGSVMPTYQIAAMTAVGGLMLSGISFRLLKIRQLPIGDLLPALVFAPLLAWLVHLIVK